METGGNNWTVISLGGSCIVPEEIDIDFLNSFRELIRSYVSRGRSFIFVTGGGKMARMYQSALAELGDSKKDDLDWLGVHAVRTNALLVTKMFGDLAHPDPVNIDPKDFSDFNKPIIVGGAWGIGTSTDFGAVHFAKRVGAMELINLSNIDQVYSADPRTDSEAKPIDSLSWVDYRDMIPSEWSPGLSTPFDPIAAKLAEEIKLKVVIMNGKNLENLSAYLDGKEFTGTVIS